MEIVIADTDPLSRLGLSSILTQLARSATIHHAEGHEGVERLLSEGLSPQFVFLSIPDAGPTIKQDTFLARYAGNLSIVLVCHPTGTGLSDALKSGVVGCLPRQFPETEMIRACLRLLEGETFFPRSVLMNVLHAPPPRLANPLAKLTRRQLETLRLIADGRTNDEIASLLSISSNTVRNHVRAILAALNVPNRGRASALARQFLTQQESSKEI